MRTQISSKQLISKLALNTEQNHNRVKQGLRVLMLAWFILTGVVSSTAYADELTRTFSFGPGTTRPSSHTRTLTVPGHTVVLVRGTLNPLPLSLTVPVVPVIIEVFKPEGGAPAASISTSAVQLVGVPFQFLVPPTFISDFGCPRSWRVTVRTPNNQAPPLRVSGSITFSFFVPGAGFPNPLPASYSVDMEGPSIHLEGGGASTTPVLAGHDPVFGGVANRSLIQGTEGTFNIKAKWDTAFNLCYLNQIFPLNVALIRPNGTVAASQTAFSQTTGNAKVDFNYLVTPADALQEGPWRLRIRNNNSVNCGFFGTVPVAIDNFDIENLVFPTFQSTFTPDCSEAVGTFEVGPDDAAVAVHQPITYAYTWTVPEPFNWHDLKALHFRITDGTDTLLWVKFDEASNSFSLFNEATGKFGKAFPAGRPNRLETPHATLHLAETSVESNGPTSPKVTLKLSLSFKPHVAGHTFDVEVAASDDQGRESNFEQVANLIIKR